MPAPIIPVSGIGGDWRVPGSYAEVLFAQGPASAAVGEREVVFVMPLLSSGTWTVNTLNRVNDAGEVELGAGPGSMLHRAIRKFMAFNKDAKCWAVPYAATTGDSPVAATGTVTFATTPTATGTASVTVCGEDCSYTYKSTDTVTTIAAGIKAAVNAKTWLPCTADNSAGVLTLTAKLTGISQGTATVGVIRYRAKITAGTTTTVATSGAFLGSGVTGAEGTTTEAANFATALATLDAVRKYYIVTSLYDATSLGNLKTHIVNKSEPRRGLRSMGMAAYTSTPAGAATIATGRNYERLNIFLFESSEHDCAEIAGGMTALVQKKLESDPTNNMAGTSLADVFLPVFDAADRPTDIEQNDSINDGLSVIATNEAGPYLVMLCNTRSKNSAGVQDDFRATETHRVSGADAFVDLLLATWAINFGQKKFKPDELLADGKFNPNQSQIAGVVRPSTLKPVVQRLMDDFDALGHLQNVAASKASVRVIKNAGRAESSFDLNIIDHLHISTFKVAEISTG